MCSMMELASFGVSQLKTQPFRKPLFNNPGAWVALKLSETAAVCAWGPSASTMLGTETGKLFSSWVGLNISCGNELWEDVCLGVRVFLPESKWTRLESDFTAATENLDGDNMGREDFLTVVTVFCGGDLFLLQIFWLLLCRVNPDTLHFICDQASCFNSSPWRRHPWLCTALNTPRSSLGMTV